jgi:hypothetical protein
VKSAREKSSLSDSCTDKIVALFVFDFGDFFYIQVCVRLSADSLSRTHVDLAPLLPAWEKGLGDEGDSCKRSIELTIKVWGRHLGLRPIQDASGCFVMV